MKVNPLNKINQVLLSVLLLVLIVLLILITIPKVKYQVCVIKNNKTANTSTICNKYIYGTTSVDVGGSLDIDNDGSIDVFNY